VQTTRLEQHFPVVSVIIPAHNESRHLEECLPSVLAQDYPTFEVILVDNGSTDDTTAVCKRFPEVKYVYFDRVKSSYAARNEGVRLARGEVIAFFDADQTAMPHYLRTLLAECVPGDPYCIYVGRLAHDPRVPAALREFCTWDWCGDDPSSGQITTAAVALPKALFDELGGFRGNIISGGDLEFFGRAVRIANVRRCNEPIGLHYWAANLKEFLLREERYSFATCLRNEREGQPTRSLVKMGLQVTGTALTKLAVAIGTPLRHPPRCWKSTWRTQWIQFLSVFYRFRGLLKFKLGSQRAGDLPKDATAERPKRSWKCLATVLNWSL
jgi:glycosyltransferase involved in cell wall biosynthesis